MTICLFKFMFKPEIATFWRSTSIIRSISSIHHVASRARDPTFEKYIDHYKNLVKVIAIHDLILANHNKTPPCKPVADLRTGTPGYVPHLNFFKK